MGASDCQGAPAGTVKPLTQRQSIEHAGKWFDLARFLGLAVDEIFPISFDLRPYVERDPAVLQGSVHRGAMGEAVQGRNNCDGATVVALYVPKLSGFIERTDHEVVPVRIAK